MSITEMLKTFIVSFQIYDTLFVIFTMTSLGSRKRPFRHRVRCVTQDATPIGWHRNVL